MQSIRNIAIIAHVDHGKTTLVDKIIDQAKILDQRKERTDLLLDNNDLERERGITILSKNVSVRYKDVGIFGCGGADIGINKISDEETFDLLKKGFEKIGYLKKRIKYEVRR